MEKEKNILSVFSAITKDINTLQDSNNITQKKETIISLYNNIVNQKPALKHDHIQAILNSFNTNLIKLALYDSIEKCRELSFKILI
jgi:hypothetical protein